MAKSKSNLFLDEQLPPAKVIHAITHIKTITNGIKFEDLDDNSFLDNVEALNERYLHYLYVRGIGCLLQKKMEEEKLSVKMLKEVQDELKIENVGFFYLACGLLISNWKHGKELADVLMPWQD